MIQSTLKSVLEFLKTQELDGEIVPKSEKIALDILYVSFGLDDQDRDVLIQINMIEQDLSGHDTFIKTKLEPKKYHIIQFFLPFPFLVEDEHIADIARLIFVVNKSLIFPGYEFSEVDRAIYYRYILMTSNGIDGRILLQIIGAISEFYETFADIFEDIALGRCSLIDVVNEIKESTK